MTDKPENAHNTTGVIPHLVVNGAREAIEFYIKAFGATKVMEMPAEDGKRLLHAQLIVNGGPLMLCDDFPEYCGGQPTEYPKRPPVTLHMAVADIDAAFAQAVAAGAAEAMKPRRHVLGRPLWPGARSVWPSLVVVHAQQAGCRRHQWLLTLPSPVNVAGDEPPRRDRETHPPALRGDP